MTKRKGLVTYVSNCYARFGRFRGCLRIERGFQDVCQSDRKRTETIIPGRPDQRRKTSVVKTILPTKGTERMVPRRKKLKDFSNLNPSNLTAVLEFLALPASEQLDTAASLFPDQAATLAAAFIKHASNLTALGVRETMFRSI